MGRLKKIIEILKIKWLKETSLTILLIAIIIAAFIGINVGIRALNPTDIDLTTEKLYTLTEISKNEVAKLPEEDKITIYLFDYPENSSVVDLARQYTKANPNITVEAVTSSERQDLANLYGIEPEYNYVLIMCGDKHKLYSIYDFATSNSSGDGVDITEQRLTNGIISVSSKGETTPIYILTGHGEYTTDTQLITFKTYLNLENYEIKNLDLLVEEKIPEDAKGLIITSPQTDITEVERDKIKDYINNGGNILWMNDPFSTDKEQPNLQSVLDLYGVTIGQDGVILEQDTSRIVMQSPNVIIPTIGYSELTEELAQNGIVMILNSGKLSFADDDKLTELGVTKTELLSTSSKSFYRKDLSISTMEPIEGEEIGTQVVGAVLEKTLEEDKTSKLVVYANNLFASDYPINTGSSSGRPAITLYNNTDLVVNSVSYIAENEDKITIRKNIDNTYYTATETQDMVVRTIIFGLPIVIVLVGILVWILRRRKK